MGGFSRDPRMRYSSISLDSGPDFVCLCFFGNFLDGHFRLRSCCRGDDDPKEEDRSDESLLYREDSGVVGGEFGGDMKCLAL